MKKLYAVLCAALFLALTTTVFAAPPDDGHPGRQGFAKQPAFDGFGPHLNLTQEQREKMKEIKSRFQADMHDLKYDVRIMRLEAEKLFTDPKTDEATLLKKEKELNALKLKLMDRKAEMKVEWRKVLTPEQLQKVGHMGRHHYYERQSHSGRHRRGPVKKMPEQGRAGKMEH